MMVVMAVESFMKEDEVGCYVGWLPALTVTASINCSRQDEVPTARETFAVFSSLSTVLCKHAPTT